VEKPWLLLDRYSVKLMTRFFPEEFEHIVQSLSLVPDLIEVGHARGPRHLWKVCKKLCIFIML
jgi:hypothetical protein